MLIKRKKKICVVSFFFSNIINRSGNVGGKKNSWPGCVNKNKIC